VLTAPSINGLDLSAWAQVASGKHRVLFIVRPQNYIDFSSLSDTIKRKIVIDTTVDLQQGEVYTMEAVLQDVDASKYGIYLRQESFIHQSFDANKNYISFFNLSGKKSAMSNLTVSPSSGYFYDTMSVYYSYYQVPIYSNSTGGTSNVGVATVMPAYNNVALTTLTGRMLPDAPYYPLPVLPMSDFYDNNGILRTYGLNTGTMPYFVFNFLASGNNINDGSGTIQSYTIMCDDDPVTVNSDIYQGNSGYAYANLNMLVQSDGQVYLYPAVYIMELVFNKTYQMQVQRKL
jgi:hypothetical protein